MFVCTTQDKPWQELAKSNKKGVELRVGEEMQEIRGFGTCFSELGALALASIPNDEKKAFLDELFDEDKCNFNYCRTPMGASDFSTDFYSYNETDGDFEMKNFSIERDKKLLLPLILEGVKRQKDMQMFASPWCPPLWLKTRRAYSNGTFRMEKAYLDAYALYFKKYIEAYKSEGVPLVHVCPQNEPCSNQVFPSCVWKGYELAEFIGGYLGEAIKDTGVDIMFGTINGPEGDDRFSWTRYSDYLGYAMQDERARKYIKAVGYQWAGKFALPQTRDDYPDLELIQTESQCGGGSNSWWEMMQIAALMRHYFRFGASAYVYWNIALEGDSSSTWGWRQNSLLHVVDGKGIYTPEFYLMKHYSHFVKRGAKYVLLKGEHASCCSAFRNPNGELVVVVQNPYKDEITITLEGDSYTIPANSVATITK